MPSDRCPTHPSAPIDDCPWCEQKIARRELAEQEANTDEADRGAERYERFLGGEQ